MVFAYNVQRVSALEASLSEPRLSRYIKKVGGDKEKALHLYGFNVAITEAFYTPIHGLEVPLRNAISNQLSTRINKHWFVNGRVPLFEYPLGEMLDEAADKLVKEHKSIDHNNMVATLNFGFWVTVLAPRYETSLWRPALRHAFPYRPKSVERRQVHGALNAVRRLRNRVAHHEPILNRNLAADHETILRVLSWICPETREWVAAHSRVPAILAAGP